MKDANAPTTANVGLTSTLIVAANEKRSGLFVRKTSVLGTIALAFGYPAVLGSGIILSGTESFSMSQYDFSTAAVYAIAGLAGATVSIQEFEVTET
jgi:hypothetical protein